MPVVPSKKVQKLGWYEQHQVIWAAVSAAIGLATGDAAALGSKCVATRTAYQNHLAAQEAAKAATAAWYSAVGDLATFGSGLISKIRTKAQTGGGDAVYQLAQVPAPATPSPVGPPGTPTNFKVELSQDGALKLTFKCANPRGSASTIYQVSRRTSPGGAFEFIGASGQRAFTDATLPAGTSGVTYQVVAVRSTVMGSPAQFNVNFGVGGGGEMTATIGPAPRGTKLAA